MGVGKEGLDEGGEPVKDKVGLVVGVGGSDIKVEDGAGS